MTKEEAAYADALNLIGSGVLSPDTDIALMDTLGKMRVQAGLTRPYVRCLYCQDTVPYDGAADGEHFADLWEHMIARHGFKTWVAEGPARNAWANPVTESERVTAA